MLRACALIFLVTGADTALSSDNWPDWRGPSADGHTDATELPLQWSDSENVAWKAAIHDIGHSTPVIWDGQVWLTTAKEDGTELYAVAYGLESGAVVHDVTVFEVADPQRINPHNTYATPSPAIEAGRVYVHYGSLGTAAIDTASGEVLWRRNDLPCEHMQGPASSPVLFEDLLILHFEGTEAPYIVALNKATGETVWRYDRPKALYEGVRGVWIKSYQTPVLVPVDGVPQMLSNGALMVTGHNPRTGEEIWRVRYRDDSTISRIVTGNGLYFINTGGSPGKSELWAIRPGGEGDLTESHVVWTMTEDAPHESSPVLVGDWLFTLSDRGILNCLNAATGAVQWTQELPGHYSASLLAAGERIYLSNKDGRTTVIAAAPEYQELAVNQIDGELWSSPAVSGNRLLLRTKTHLYCIADD